MKILRMRIIKTSLTSVMMRMKKNQLKRKVAQIPITWPTFTSKCNMLLIKMIVRVPTNLQERY